MRAEGSVSSKFPRIEPSAYSKTKFTERIVALAGVPDDLAIDGIDGQFIGQTKRGKSGGITSGNHLIGVALFGKGFIREGTCQHGSTGNRTESPEGGTRLFGCHKWLSPNRRSGRQSPHATHQTMPVSKN